MSASIHTLHDLHPHILIRAGMKWQNNDLKLVYYKKQNKSKIVKIEQNDRIKHSLSATHDFQTSTIQGFLGCLLYTLKN